MPKRQKLNPKDKGVKIMDEVYMLIMDGTSYGEYENSATALLFKTYEEAEEAVKALMAKGVKCIMQEDLSNI